MAPDILHPTVDYAAWLIRNGRKHPDYPAAMPSFSATQLSDEDLTDILEWADSKPQPTTGEGLYRDYCRNCHGDDGRGTAGHNAKGRSVSQLTQMIRNGHGGTNFSNRTSYMPKWTASEISDADIAKIQQYTN